MMLPSTLSHLKRYGPLMVCLSSALFLFSACPSTPSRQEDSASRADSAKKATAKADSSEHERARSDFFSIPTSQHPPESERFRPHHTKEQSCRVERTTSTSTYELDPFFRPLLIKRVDDLIGVGVKRFDRDGAGRAKGYRLDLEPPGKALQSKVVRYRYEVKGRQVTVIQEAEGEDPAFPQRETFDFDDQERVISRTRRLPEGEPTTIRCFYRDDWPERVETTTGTNRSVRIYTYDDAERLIGSVSKQTRGSKVVIRSTNIIRAQEGGFDEDSTTIESSRQGETRNRSKATYRGNCAGALFVPCSPLSSPPPPPPAPATEATVETNR